MRRTTTSRRSQRFEEDPLCTERDVESLKESWGENFPNFLLIKDILALTRWSQMCSINKTIIRDERRLRLTYSPVGWLMRSVGWFDLLFTFRENCEKLKYTHRNWHPKRMKNYSLSSVLNWSHLNVVHSSIASNIRYAVYRSSWKFEIGGCVSLFTV